MAMAVHQRTVLNSVCAGAGLMGLAIIAYGTTLPVYTDPVAAQAIKTGACDANGPIAGWDAPLVALETWRHPLIQTGISLALGAATVFGLSQAFRREPSGGWSTPASRLAFFALGYTVLAAGWAATVYSLVLDARRGNFAWCADTIIIPAFSLTVVFGALAAVCTIVGVVLTLAFGRLPVSLWHWNADRRTQSILATVALGPPAMAMACLTVVQAPSSAFFGTPAGIIAIYLILAARAAILAPRVSVDASAIEQAQSA